MGKWDRTIIVTGGAGFIGSCMVRTLNDMGLEDIVIVDNIRETAKWRNLGNKKYLTYVNRDDFLKRLRKGCYRDVCGVIHMGACSSTTEKNFDYLWKNNVEFSKSLWDYCAVSRIPFIYASSAATYGSGEAGFDDGADIDTLRPLNGYGYSKQSFDQWATRQENRPSQYVGLKFFNVYGPNEYCKGSMASMAYHGYRQLKESGVIRLFRSDNPGYADGGQLRDFVYVKDVCRVIRFFMEHGRQDGIFNVGTGRAQSFAELAGSVFTSLGLEPNIEYVAMPEELRGKYQYYTQAKLKKLREAGYQEAFMGVQEGVRDYVTNYLEQGYAPY